MALSHETVRLVSDEEVDDFSTTILDYENLDSESSTSNEEYVDCHDDIIPVDNEDLARDGLVTSEHQSMTIMTSPHPTLAITTSAISVVSPPPVPPLLNERVAKAISSGKLDYLCLELLL